MARYLRFSKTCRARAPRRRADIRRNRSPSRENELARRDGLRQQGLAGARVHTIKTPRGIRRQLWNWTDRANDQSATSSWASSRGDVGESHVYWLVEHRALLLPNKAPPRRRLHMRMKNPHPIESIGNHERRLGRKLCSPRAWHGPGPHLDRSPTTTSRPGCGEIRLLALPSSAGPASIEADSTCLAWRVMTRNRNGLGRVLAASNCLTTVKQPGR